MLKKPRSCEGCPLEVKGTGFSYPSGSGKNRVMILGEALGAEEAEKGEPFVGGAGRVLNQILRRSGLNREDFVIWNSVACRPPENKLRNCSYQWGAINHCRKNLEHFLADYKPEVVVTLGDISTQNMLRDLKLGITKARGYSYDAFAGSWGGKVIPSYHPAWLMHTGAFNLTGVIGHDLTKAQKIATVGEKDYWPEYFIDPGLELLSWWVQEALNRGKVLAADIETSFSHSLEEDTYDTLEDVEIERISFAFEKANALTVPWDSSTMPFIKQLLEHKWQEGLVFWNADFDLPRLRAKGIKDCSNIIDAMWMWHFLQSDLPKGLGFVSTFFTPLKEWKSQAKENFALYSAIDSDATIWNFLEIRERLIKEGRWSRFWTDVVELDPLVKQMGNKGLLVDQQKRENLRVEIEQLKVEAQQELSKEIPQEIRPFRLRKTISIKSPCSRCSGTGREPDKKELKRFKLKLADLPITWDHEGYYEIYYKANLTCSKCEGQGEQVKYSEPTVKAEVGEWFECEGKWKKWEDFNALSPVQVLDYIKFNSHGQEEETNEQVLEKLIKKYPNDKVYPLVLNIRGLNKIYSTYIEGYRPALDGRLKTEFGYHPSTWRFSSRRPNIQNIPNPKRCELEADKRVAKAIRNCYVAEKGKVLVAVDFSAIEAVLAGYYAKDFNYIKACKLGIHGILASHQMVLMGLREKPITLDMSDAEILAQVKEIKKNHPLIYARAKPVTHGSTFGATAFKLKVENPTAFKTVREAAELQNILFREIGKNLHQWQWETLYEVFKNGYIDNAFQYRHWFFRALSYSSTTAGYISVAKLMERVFEEVNKGFIGQALNLDNYTIAWAEDAKRILGFRPQSTAAAIMRRSMRLLEKKFKDYIRWTIHDELIFELPKEAEKDLTEEIVSLMSSPIEELEGLAIGVEYSRGEKWGELD